MVINGEFFVGYLTKLFRKLHIIQRMEE